MFQRLQICQNLARKIAREHNDNLIEESTKYFNSKVKPLNFKEADLVMMKEHNFKHKNRKLSETFQGPLKITKFPSNVLVCPKPILTACSAALQFSGLKSSPPHF
jgi:hypothetical protein